jgi:hypothetical protein
MRQFRISVISEQSDTNGRKTPAVSEGAILSSAEYKFSSYKLNLDRFLFLNHFAAGKVSGWPVSGSLN